MDKKFTSIFKGLSYKSIPSVDEDGVKAFTAIAGDENELIAFLYEDPLVAVDILNGLINKGKADLVFGALSQPAVRAQLVELVPREAQFILERASEYKLAADPDIVDRVHAKIMAGDAQKIANAALKG